MQAANTQQMVRAWFAAKQRELAASAEQAVLPHGGLIGDHRENVHRALLRDVIPARYDVGRGVICGLLQQSRETDMVVWDAANYVSLPISDHALYLVESVRAAIEVKSNWSRDNFADICGKVLSVREIVPMRTPDYVNLAEELDSLWLEIASVRDGRPHDGTITTPHHVACAAIVLSGGSSVSIEGLMMDIKNYPVDDCFPDLLLLTDPGTIFVKEYDPPVIYQLGFGADALMVFTHYLLRLTLERSVRLEGAIDLGHYIPFDLIDEAKVLAHSHYELRRLPPGRQILWRES